MKNSLKIFCLLEMVPLLLLLSGAADANMAYIFLFVLALGIWKLPELEALQLYVFSIPVFVAMPASPLSEAMSVWRIALLVLTFKVLLNKLRLVAILKDRNLDLTGKGRALRENLGALLGEIKNSNYYSTLRPVLLFGAVGIFSLLFAVSIGAGVKKMIFLGSVFLLFGIVFSAVRSRADWLKLLKSVYAAAVFILLVGYGQLLATFFVTLSDFWGAWDNYVINAFYGEKTMVLLSYSNTWFSYYGPGDVIPPTLRMFSVMPDSHSFAMLMILFAPLALFFAQEAKSRRAQWAHRAVFLLMLLAVFFSGTRGAWVGWLGALVAALVLYLGKRLPRRFELWRAADREPAHRLYKLVLASVLSLIVLFPVSNFVLSANQDSQLIRAGKLAGQAKMALFKRTLSISDMEETSNKGRMEIWRDSAASFAAHPLTGIGIGNFPLALSEKLATAKMGASAHNIYLDILVEMGIGGLLFFLLLLVRIGEKLFRLSQTLREKNCRLLAGAGLVYFAWSGVYGLFDVVIFNDKVLMFAVIILALFYRMESVTGEGTEGGK